MSNISLANKLDGLIKDIHLCHSSQNKNVAHKNKAFTIK